MFQKFCECEKNMKLGGKIRNSAVDPMQKELIQLDFSVKRY